MEDRQTDISLLTSVLASYGSSPSTYLFLVTVYVFDFQLGITSWFLASDISYYLVTIVIIVAAVVAAAI
jgi:hypothetical protein